MVAYYNQNEIKTAMKALIQEYLNPAPIVKFYQKILSL